MCRKCRNNRIATISAKCSDLCNVSIIPAKKSHTGYVPDSLGIGGGDYVEFSYCLDCGQMQGDFPISVKDAEEGDKFYLPIDPYELLNLSKQEAEDKIEAIGWQFTYSQAALRFPGRNNIYLQAAEDGTIVDVVLLD